MQTIPEPDDSRSYSSPTMDDIQEGTLTKGSGQEGSHFKKRKPMKTTSRGSMRKLMDNMMEHDQDDRQVNNSQLFYVFLVVVRVLPSDSIKC